jgi:hypothetical protein
VAIFITVDTVNGAAVSGADVLALLVSSRSPPWHSKSWTEQCNVQSGTPLAQDPDEVYLQQIGKQELKRGPELVKRTAAVMEKEQELIKKLEGSRCTTYRWSVGV